MTVHILPIDDEIEHEMSENCICGPDYTYIDPETGESFETPVAMHHSLDGRELEEENGNSQDQSAD